MDVPAERNIETRGEREDRFASERVDCSPRDGRPCFSSLREPSDRAQTWAGLYRGPFVSATLKNAVSFGWPRSPAGSMLERHINARISESRERVPRGRARNTCALAALDEWGRDSRANALKLAKEYLCRGNVWRHLVTEIFRAL